jgi:acetate kinase
MPAVRPANVLALNSGSSTLKFGLFRVDPDQAETLLSGEMKDGAENAVGRVAKALSGAKQPAPDAIGHRVVHGGPKLDKHCIIDPSVMGELESVTAFAPLHIPAALALIRAAQKQFPGVPQTACFDTAFHAGMPDVARTLPLPNHLRSDGVHRYGFHGLSCESIVRQLGGSLPERLVIAHLGNGASVTAVKAGQSIDTSMGLTPSGGVIMGTRSGDLDPGVLIYLVREKKLDAPALERLIDRQSGLLGISGVSGDMRTLHEAAPANADVRLAIAMFCASARKQIAAMIAVLGGVDMVVFTGGIGENDAAVRDAIRDGLSWVGVDCVFMVLPSQEDEQIAFHTQALLSRER